MAYKQKGMDFGNKKPGPPKHTPGHDKFLEEQNESEVTSMDYLRKTPSIVASKSAKKNYDDYGKVVSDKETKRINTTPNTKPPMFSGDKAHNIAANITEGSIESQNLRRKENEKKKKK